MLTIEEVRESLSDGINDDFSDQEIVGIRDSIHALASVFVDSFLDARDMPA